MKVLALFQSVLLHIAWVFISSPAFAQSSLKISNPMPGELTELNRKIEMPGQYTFKVTAAGNERYYRVHVPTQYAAKAPAPVVVVFHGAGLDMEIQATDEFYKLVSKSEKEGFLAVFPNGYSKLKSGKGATWNAGKCCGQARAKKIDDVGFIKEMISQLKKQFNIDQKKIFAVGMSNGAMLSYRLACELPQVFRGIAAVAGADSSTDCKHAVPLSILHLHSKNDNSVKLTGISDKSKENEFLTVAETITKWVKINKCESTAKRILENPQVFCEKYSKCLNNTEIRFCVTETGGHSWPGGKNPGAGGESPSAAISATDVMWDFFTSIKNN